MILLLQLILKKALINYFEKIAVRMKFQFDVSLSVRTENAQGPLNFTCLKIGKYLKNKKTF